MSEELKNSPLPWSSAPQRGIPNHCTVAQVFDADGWTLAEIEPTVTPDDANAVVEFIVRACNSHYALLMACQHFVSHYPRGVNRDLDEAYVFALDAISKATGAKS